jgi:hypothetical protein
MNRWRIYKVLNKHQLFITTWAAASWQALLRVVKWCVKTQFSKVNRKGEIVREEMFLLVICLHHPCSPWHPSPKTTCEDLPLGLSFFHARHLQGHSIQLPSGSFLLEEADHRQHLRWLLLVSAPWSSCLCTVVSSLQVWGAVSLGSSDWNVAKWWKNSGSTYQASFWPFLALSLGPSWNYLLCWDLTYEETHRSEIEGDSWAMDLEKLSPLNKIVNDLESDPPPEQVFRWEPRSSQNFN